MTEDLLAVAVLMTGSMMTVAAAAALLMRSLLSAVILTGFVSLSAAVLFLVMGAPDVAITEASIGAGISTLIFIWGRSRTGEDR